MIFPLNSALIGPANERPDPNDPKIPRNGSTPPIYICIDTLEVFQDVGRGWLQVGSIGGTSLSGVTSDGHGGVLINRVQAAGLSTALLPAPLQGVAINPASDPSHVYVLGDVATGDAAFGASLVTYESWTPTVSGTMTLIPAPPGNLAIEVDLYVYAGSVIGTDVPSRDGSGTHGSQLADASTYYDGANFISSIHYAPATFTVVAGQTYTVALTSYYVDVTAAIGQSVSLRTWRLSTEIFGGQTLLVPWATITGAFASGEGLAISATGDRSHSEGLGSDASGPQAHAEGTFTESSGDSAHGEGIRVKAIGKAAHAEGFGSEASGDGSHAEGGEDGGVTPTKASGRGAHAEGVGTEASGDASHAEGSGTIAPGIEAHAENHNTTAPGYYSHSEGNNSVSAGHASHAQNSHGDANGSDSTALGSNAVAALTTELAHGFGDFGDHHGTSQYSRLGVKVVTTDATVTALQTPDGTSPDTASDVPPGPLTLPTDTTWQILVQVGASQFDTPGTVAGWTLRALVTVVGGTARQIGSTDLLAFKDAAASTWGVALSAHDTQLDINVTGEAGKTIRWVAALHVVQVGI